MNTKVDGQMDSGLNSHNCAAPTIANLLTSHLTFWNCSMLNLEADPHYYFCPRKDNS